MMHHTGGSTPDRTSPGYVADSPDVGASIAYHAGLADPGCGGAAGQGYPTRPSATGPKLYTSGDARYIGIEPQNSGREPWEPELYDAFVRSAAAVLCYKGLSADRAHLPSRKEYAPSRKVDPNLNMDAFRRTVQHLIDRVHFEPTHKFQSRYVNANGVRPEHYETLMGYILNNNRKIEDLRAITTGPTPTADAACEGAG